MSESARAAAVLLVMIAVAVVAVLVLAVLYRDGGPEFVGVISGE